MHPQIWRLMVKLDFSLLSNISRFMYLSSLLVISLTCIWAPWTYRYSINIWLNLKNEQMENSWLRQASAPTLVSTSPLLTLSTYWIPNIKTQNWQKKSSLATENSVKQGTKVWKDFLKPWGSCVSQLHYQYVPMKEQSQLPT